MWNHLFKHVDIKPENVHILNGNAPDLDEECRKFEQAIEDVGGIELFMGGTSSSTDWEDSGSRGKRNVLFDAITN